MSSISLPFIKFLVTLLVHRQEKNTRFYNFTSVCNRPSANSPSKVLRFYSFSTSLCPCPSSQAQITATIANATVASTIGAAVVIIAGHFCWNSHKSRSARGPFAALFIAKLASCHVKAKFQQTIVRKSLKVSKNCIRAFRFSGWR